MSNFPDVFSVKQYHLLNRSCVYIYDFIRLMLLTSLKSEQRYLTMEEFMHRFLYDFGMNRYVGNDN